MAADTQKKSLLSWRWKSKTFYLDLRKIPKKRKSKILIKLVVSEIQNWNCKRIYYYYYYGKRCWVWKEEEEEEEEGAWNQKSHERKSKTILNIKKTKAKNQNNLFCNWQTYTRHKHIHVWNKKLYIILYCIWHFTLRTKTKKKRKETLLLCKTMCENNLKVIIYIYIYTIYVMSRAKSKAVEITATDLYPSSHPLPLHFTCHPT